MGLCEVNLVRLMKFMKENGGMDGRSFCMLGRQEISTTVERFKRIAEDFGFYYDEKALNKTFQERVDTYQFFYMMGFKEVCAIDISEYDRPTVVFDLSSTKLPQHLTNKFDFILDGGTSEHVFNVPQVMKNILGMLKTGGYVVHIVPCAGYINHGFYSFSPDFYVEYYKQNGFEVKDININWFIGNEGQNEADRKYFSSIDCRLFQNYQELNRYMALMQKTDVPERANLWVTAQKKEHLDIGYPKQQIYVDLYRRYEEKRVDMEKQIDLAVDILKNPGKQKITLYCAGDICARLLKKAYENSLEDCIECVLDHDMNKCYSRYYGIPVLYPNRKNIENKDILICSDKFADEIFLQLDKSYSGIYSRLQKITEL